MPQLPESSLAGFVEEHQSSITCFTVSPSSQYVCGDSKGNLYVGVKQNRVVSFTEAAVFTGEVLRVFCDGASVICVGREKESREILVKTVEVRGKKSQVKSVSGTGMSENLSSACISPDNQTMALCDVRGSCAVFRLQKFKQLFVETLKNEKPIPAQFCSFLFLDQENTLRPSETPRVQAPLRGFFVCGTAGDQSQAAVFVFNIQSGEAQSISLSKVFAVTPFAVPAGITMTDNRVVYVTGQRAKAGQPLLEQIYVQDQKKIMLPADIKQVNHVVKAPLLPQMVQKEGNVVQIASFKSSEIILHTDTFVQIHTLKNRALYVATEIQASVLIGFDPARQSYLLLNNSPNQISLTELNPIEPEQRIDSLLAAGLYEEALSLALDPRSRCKPYKVASVRQAYAERLFQEQAFEAACDQYIETIGMLEASIVVRAFLDAGRSVELTRYLEALHQQKVATTSHTNLLMSCYNKNNDEQRLIQFVRSAEELFIARQEQPVFNVQVACQNLIQAKLPKLATEVAVVLENEVYGVQLLIKQGRVHEAVKLLRTLPAPKAHECAVQYGSELMDTQDHILEICALVKDLCLAYEQQNPSVLKALVPKDVDIRVDQHWHYADLLSRKTASVARVECHSRIDQFVHLFVDQKLEIHLVKLLEAIISQALQPAHLRGLTISDVAIETYFELLLKQLGYKLKKLPDCEGIPFIEDLTEEKILAVLRALDGSSLKYSDDHLLILFQTYDVKSCVIETLKKLNMTQECIKFYARNNQIQEAIELYQKADEDTRGQLYTDLLQIAVQTKQPENIKQVLKLFEQNQTVSTMNIVELLVQADADLPLEVVYEFLKTKLQTINEQMVQSYTAYTGTMKRLEEVRKQAEDMKKPRLFQRQNCRKCGLPTDPPCVLVRCGHSFHERCWKSDGQRCSCWAQKGDGAGQMQFEVASFQTFADVLGGLTENPYVVKGAAPEEK